MNVIEWKKSTWKELEKKIQSRDFSPKKIEAARKIIRDVRRKGDRALRKFTLEFDGAEIKSLRVPEREIRSARKVITPEVKKSFRRVEGNIRRYCLSNLIKSWRQGRGDGHSWGEKVTPIERVGIYVPGGKAPLVSSLFMAAVPARLAGVARIAICTPPQTDGTINPYILAAADFLGIGEIYRIGGAQAIAALAFGTETVPRVDKIVGPGNIYVTLAKKEVYGIVGIDMLAGPSEVVILADGKARPAFIAADLLAQAEHGGGGMSILITSSGRLISGVKKEADSLLSDLSRKSILGKSLKEGTWLIKVKSIKNGIDLVNRIAPEHLEIMAGNPDRILPAIKNAGAIFLGEYSPVAAGDYVAGPSHILPTGRSARFFSPLSAIDFSKRSSVIRYNRRALRRDMDALKNLAELEGLDAHALSVSIRL